MFEPKLLTCLREGYSLPKFFADLNAGVIVGIVALPLAMAFAIASGVSPEAGLVTAVVGGLLISLLGGSRVQIGGPTGAFIVIVYGIVETQGVQGLLASCFLAGALLTLMGVCKLGALIKFIPFPVTMGFTNGIAALILLSQAKDFLGLRTAALPSEFFEKVGALYAALGTASPASVAMALGCLVLVRFWPRRWARVAPGSLVAIVLAGLAASQFDLGIETIGQRFGELPRSLPAPSWLSFEGLVLADLIRPAFTIAILAAVESLLSAVVADAMIEDRHDSNQELVAQGVANMVSPLFGGIPVTGAIARTATNIRGGGATPIAGVVHALVVLLALLVAAPLAKHIPMAALSAVLVNVALNMGEWKEFAMLRKYPRSDALVLLSTFGLTVVADLTVAVEVGIALASLLFIKRVAETSSVDLVDHDTETEGARHSIHGRELPPGVLLYRVFGPMFFGAADKLERVLIGSAQMPRVVILRLRKVNSMDSTALNALSSLHRKLRARGAFLVLSSPREQPLSVMERAGFVDEIGRENVCPDIEAALDRANRLLKANTGL